MKSFNQFNKPLLLYTFIVIILTCVGVIFLLNDIVNCFQVGVNDTLRIGLVALSGLFSSLIWGIIFYRVFESFREKEDKGFLFPKLIRNLSRIYLLTFWGCLTLTATGLNRLVFTILDYDKTKSFFGLPFLFLAIIIYITYLKYAKLILKDSAIKLTEESK